MSSKSNSNNSGGGCIGVLAMIAVFALGAWAFMDLDPRAAVIFGFKAWLTAVSLLVAVVLGIALVAGR